MRIVFTIGSLAGGGAERVLSWLAGELAELGHDVVVLTQRDPQTDFYRLSPRVRRVGHSPRRVLNSSRVSVVFNGLRWATLLLREARAVPDTVVVSFIDKLNTQVLCVLAASRVRVIVAERTDVTQVRLTRVWEAARRMLYRRRADHVVVLRESHAKWLRETWGVARCSTIPNPVILVPAPRTDVASRTILCVGRLSPEKGHDILIKAWSLIAPRCPDWQVRLVGDGPSRASLVDLADACGVSASVVFAGASQRVAEEYASAGLFVLPSRIEGFPNALLEAMASGCAVVAASTAGASVEILAGGQAGCLVEGEDPSALAAVLLALIESPARRQELGAKARQRARDFSGPEVLQRWMQVIG